MEATLLIISLTFMLVVVFGLMYAGKRLINNLPLIPRRHRFKKRKHEDLYDLDKRSWRKFEDSMK